LDLFLFTYFIIKIDTVPFRVPSGLDIEAAGGSIYTLMFAQLFVSRALNCSKLDMGMDKSA